MNFRPRRRTACSISADHIAMRSHRFGVPLRDFRVPHGESVCVLGHRARETGTRLDVQVDPGIRIKLLCRELRYQVLVSKVGNGAILLEMKTVVRGAGNVHVVRVPVGIA